MNKFYRLFALSLVLILALPLALSVGAQELPGPGEGGAVIRGNTRGSANLGSLIPIRCSGVDCADPNNVMWPGLVGLDPETQSWGPDTAGQLANGWTISEDGRTYTVTMRQDATWNDGTPITALDVYFTWDAYQQGQAIGLSSSYAPSAQILEAAEIIDDYTIAFTTEVASCETLRYLGIPAMPAHVFGYTADGSYDWNSFVELAESTYDRTPIVTSGPFNFFRTEPGTAVFLVANPDYWAPTNGQYVVPEGWVYVDTPDETVMIERFLTFTPGDINFVFEPTANFATLRNSDAQFFESPGRVWHYMGINLADPTNPQNGLDADGNPIDQGRHPLFGDVTVRQALQHAVDINEIIEGVFNGDASPMVGSTIPTAYTIHPTLERRAFDLDAARALLEEAGWVSTGSPIVAGGDGLRTCVGCSTAAEGTPFSFSLLNPGGPRNDVSVLIQASFAQIGIQVNVQPLDFNTLYDDNMGAQIFDAAIAGWRGAFPFDADQRSFFGAANDIYGEGYGFNFTSYYNAEFEELGAQVNSLPGCDLDERIAIAHRMQEILYEEQPYIWLYALNSVYAAAPNVQGFAPYPNLGQWNVDAWNVVE